MTLVLYAYLVSSPTVPFITVQRVVVSAAVPAKVDKKLSGFWVVVAHGEAKQLGQTLRSGSDTAWILRALSLSDREKLGVD